MVGNAQFLQDAAEVPDIRKIEEVALIGFWEW